MTERETHDFMNVESFSQLPFIRPSPSSSRSEKPIRLFGIEFPTNSPDQLLDTTIPNHNTTTDDHFVAKESGAVSENNNHDDKSNSTNNSNNRRFECHYCCRNFPTSQALGGHQNAHKRERQHAKRAHLHGIPPGTSSYLSDVAHHPFYAPISYRTTTHAPFSSYSSWNGGGTTTSTNGTTSSSSRTFYGNGGGSSYSSSSSSSSSSSQQQQPITGSPLGFWRIPSATTRVDSGTGASLRDRAAAGHHVPLPLLGGEDVKGGVGRSSRYDPNPNVQQKKDLHHVSLDLHL